MVSLYGPRGTVEQRIERADELPPRKSSGLSMGQGQAPGILIGGDDQDGELDHVVFPFMRPTRKRNAPLTGWAEQLAMWLRNPHVSGCVGAIAGAMARRGWRLVPAKGYTEAQAAHNIAILEEFYSRLHRFLSFDEILGQLLPQLVMRNHAFAEVGYGNLAAETDHGRRPAAIFPIADQGSIHANLGADGDFRDPAWRQVIRSGSGGQVQIRSFAWEEILFLRLPELSRNGIYPVGPIEKLQVHATMGDAAARYTNSYFNSGGKIGLLFELPDGTPNAKAKALAWIDYIKEEFSAPDQGHNTMVLYDGMTAGKAPSAEKDTQIWIDVQRFSRDVVCSVFGVPPRVIGAEASGNLGGKSEREQIWWEFMTNCVEPKVDAFNAGWTNQVHRQGFGIFDVDFELIPDRANPSEESRLTLANTARIAAGTGYIDVDSLDDLNALRREQYPDMEPLLTVPKKFIETATEAEKKPEEIATGGAMMKARAKATARPRRPSSAASKRLDRKAALAMLEAHETAAADEIMVGVKDMAAKVIDKLARVYAAKDQKALKDFNFAPGGSALKASGKARLKSIYQQSYDASEREIKALAKTIKAEQQKQKRSDPHIQTKGSINDYLDLVSTAYFDDLFNEVATEARDIYLEGAKAGWSVNEFTKALTTAFDDIDESDVKTNVRTISNEFFNLAREQTYRESGGAVETVEYVFIDDDALCEICEAFRGVVFAGLDDPNLAEAMPPNHWSCRCGIVSVMAGEDWTPTPDAEVQDALRDIQPGFGASTRSRERYGWFRRNRTGVAPGGCSGH